METGCYINEKYPLSGLTGRIIKCAIEVHNSLGKGFPEFIYQKALAIAFKGRTLSLNANLKCRFVTRANTSEIGEWIFFVVGEVMVEINAVLKLDDAHLAQAINYLEAYGKRVGLLTRIMQ